MTPINESREKKTKRAFNEQQMSQRAEKEQWTDNTYSMHVHQNEYKIKQKLERK